ncbi:ABC transporter ATP-binding protein [Candidimonas nitroreducens]|uniref:ABC transporter ATP-binding protein n=1 Tax=Candidimonas nitroreducens TaxID=683354 RepID=A0A225MRH7_9BURK|nr:ABC transporter ATP-binding protein [Candidimonas nitroreducens]OWT63856.1 ABC transporter ATP-binding protein [Candidimonas nitroreducens]
MAHVKASNLLVEMPIYELSSRSMKLRVLGALKNNRFGTDGDVTVVRALQNINFEFRDGDRIGLIGANGAGKSTLLRVLAGIYEPTGGELQIDGKAVALLEMGLGMDDTLTGYQNIKLRGMLLGMKPGEVESHTQEIAEFTELGDYLHLPIRTYSSGMRIRLAFAISTTVHADLLLLDEVIGVGDAAFIEKANTRLRNFQNRAKIVFIASHSGAVISDMCNKAIWLDGGSQMFVGGVREALNAYSESLHG